MTARQKLMYAACWSCKVGRRTVVFPKGRCSVRASHFFALALLFCGGLPIEVTAADPPKVVLIVHGGAGVVSPKEMAEDKLNGQPVTRKDYEDTLAQSLEAGYRVLKGKTSVDAVEAAIRVLEDSELFNAGRGAVLTHDGRAELDASIMEGRVQGAGDAAVGKRDPRKRAGAVTGVTHVKNPISAARAVMEMPGGRHMFLAGEGAERYVLGDAIARKYRIEPVSNAYFWTDRRLRAARKAVGKTPGRESAAAAGRPDQAFGTVGAIALDSRGTLTAGTSTGGVSDKWTGRIGDSPVIGAGNYADDRACGVSCSGTGELFIRHAVAYDVAARMIYSKADVAAAARATMDQLPDDEDGVGGLIALDRDGRHTTALSPKTAGMYRGYVTEAGDIYVAIYAKDEYKLARRADAKAADGSPGK
jgi:beta-aspartyl-peptidase (threonine type)